MNRLGWILVGAVLTWLLLGLVPVRRELEDDDRGWDEPDDGIQPPDPRPHGLWISAGSVTGEQVDQAAPLIAAAEREGARRILAGGRWWYRTGVG